MTTGYRFNRDEISNILKRAAELEYKDNDGEEGDGLTLEELQQVSREVGIDPKYISLAMDELQTEKVSAVPGLFGGPFTYRTNATADRPIEDDEWEDIVTEIRNIHGGIGRTGKLGKTFEWEQRKREVGYIQISISPKEDHSRIHINANYRYYAMIVYMLTGIFGLMFTGILFDEVALPYITRLIVAPAFALSLFAGARFYLSGWMKRKRTTYQKLISRFRELLGGDDSEKTGELESSGPSITMEEDQDRAGSERQRIERNRQRS